MGDSGAMITWNGTGTYVRASLVCPNCNYLDLAGFPVGFRFDPSDQELIEHLESKVFVKEGGGSRAHALINQFIPTIEGDIGICYTHPENLPGVTRDGLSKYFFYKTSKAYRTTSTRMRRKIMSEHGQSSSKDVGVAHWHQTGKMRPVIVGGRQKGCKKVLVLNNMKHGKPEKTNWVMHQYHLGMNEEKDGELVVSKVFYRCHDATMTEQNDENEVDSDQAGVGDPVSGDQGQVHGKNNHHIPSQHPVQSVPMEPDTTLSLQVGVAHQVSGDQGQVHRNNHHIPSQHHVQSVDSEPDTTLSLGLATDW